MAYYFMARTSKGDYQKLDITKSTCFTKLSKFRQPGACSLEEIDMFTTAFFNELELRTHLIEEGILPINLADKQLSIRIPKNNIYHKVMYDFLYQKDIEYIANPAALLNEIYRRDISNDFLFLRELANNYQGFHDCSSSAPELRELANNSLNWRQRVKELNNLDQEGNPLSIRVVKLLIYDYYQDSTGKITYNTSKIKHPHLHSIIAFMNNYDKKQKEKEASTKEKTSILPNIPTKENTQSFSSPKKRVRTKSKEEIPGQYSLFEEEQTSK